MRIEGKKGMRRIKFQTMAERERGRRRRRVNYRIMIKRKTEKQREDQEGG